MRDEVDGRRRRYVPLDVYVAHGEFGTKLYHKWGMEGLCTWMLFLAACKRETNQGTMRYATEDEAWGKLGARATLFSIDEFFAFTGRHKKTSRRRHGRLVDVLCTPWEQWNKEFNRQIEAEEKSRKRGTNTPTKPGQNPDNTPTEVDLEVDLEESPKPPFHENPLKCKVCHLVAKTTLKLEEHLANVHWIDPAPVIELRRSAS